MVVKYIEFYLIIITSGTAAKNRGVWLWMFINKDSVFQKSIELPDSKKSFYSPGRSEVCKNLPVKRLLLTIKTDEFL